MVDDEEAREIDGSVEERLTSQVGKDAGGPKAKVGQPQNGWTNGIKNAT